MLFQIFNYFSFKFSCNTSVFRLLIWFESLSKLHTIEGNITNMYTFIFSNGIYYISFYLPLSTSSNTYYFFKIFYYKYNFVSTLFFF